MDPHVNTRSRGDVLLDVGVEVIEAVLPLFDVASPAQPSWPWWMAASGSSTDVWYSISGIDELRKPSGRNPHLG
jgi:hypothetical protein